MQASGASQRKISTVFLQEHFHVYCCTYNYICNRLNLLFISTSSVFVWCRSADKRRESAAVGSRALLQGRDQCLLLGGGESPHFSRQERARNRATGRDILPVLDFLDNRAFKFGAGRVA